MDEYDGRQIVGIDLHRRRSVIVRMTEAGERLGVARIDNDPVALGLEIAKAGRSPEVVLEAMYGWYWAADVLAEAGARVHLAHPLGVKAFAHRRVKNDVRDATDLADLLRMGRLPEAYVAPPAVRELRELVRHRAKLVALRAGLKAQVHAVLAKQGVTVRASDVFGVFGRAQLDKLPLGAPYRARVNSLLRLIDAYTFEIDTVTARLQAQLAGQPGYQALLSIPGVGSVLAGIFYAEIGDVRRFRTAKQLCSWAGLTPRHYESDTTVRRGSITKQGSALVRWAAIEAVQKLPADGGWLVANRARLTERRGRNVATVATARKLLNGGLLRPARRAHPRPAPGQDRGVSRPGCGRVRDPVRV
jgi:transposase